MKTTQHSTNPKPVTKKQARREMNAELSIGSWTDHRKIDSIRTLLKDLLLMMKENPKMITLGPWLEKHDIAKQTVDDWREKYPEVQYIHTKAKNIMSQRIQEKSFYRECDSAFARFCLPNYDDDFVKLEEWRATLRQPSTQELDQYVRIVHVPTFVESGKVPPKTQDTNE